MPKWLRQAADLIGALSGTAVSTRYKMLTELLYTAEVQTSAEMKKQSETSAKMMVTATELTFMNDFGDNVGVVSWANFTKGVAEAIGL